MSGSLFHHTVPRTFHPPIVSVTARKVVGLLVFIAVAVPSVLLWSLALVPAAIEGQVLGGVLQVKAGMGLLRQSQRVPLDQIRVIRTVEVANGRRRNGTALPGHCSGWWTYPTLGEVWQATDCRAKLLLIDTPSLRLLLSADDHVALTEALHGNHPWQESTESSLPSWLRLLFVAAAIASVFGGLLLAALTLRGPESLSYTVDGSTLTVRSLLGQRRISLAGLTVRRCPGGLGLRVGGTGLPGYFTGWFLVEGRRARVWATLRQQGVLLEGDGRYLLTPQDVEGFLVATQEGGARLLP